MFQLRPFDRRKPIDGSLDFLNRAHPDKLLIPALFGNVGLSRACHVATDLPQSGRANDVTLAARGRSRMVITLAFDGGRLPRQGLSGNSLTQRFGPGRTECRSQSAECRMELQNRWPSRPSALCILQSAFPSPLNFVSRFGGSSEEPGRVTDMGCVFFAWIDTVWLLIDSRYTGVCLLPSAFQSAAADRYLVKRCRASRWRLPLNHPWTPANCGA